MENPFRDGGPAQLVMPYVSLVVSGGLLAEGVVMYRAGGSAWWAVAAGVMVFGACWEIYRQIRSVKGKHATPPS